MNYRIMHETERSLRLRLRYAPLGESEEALLRFRLQKLPSVRSVSFFRQTGGILISFSGGREEILSLLLRGEEEELRRSARCLDFLTNLLEKNAPERKESALSPSLKKRLRSEIITEAFIDLLLPMPISMAYHVFKFLELERM